MKMSKVLITGGTGAIGQNLIPRLLSEGWQVNVVGRSANAILPEGCSYYQWDLQKMKMPKASLEGVSHIVHLAGAGIADERWTDNRKREIRDSRVNPILLISRTIRELGTKLDCVVSASGIGYYGAVTKDKIFVEDDDPNLDFLGRTCQAWENAITYISDSCKREVRLRTGVVLMKDQGAIPKLIMPAKFGLGSPLGTGEQWMPWIHIDDLVALYVKALTNKNMSGAYNAAVPAHTTNKDFVLTINSILNRPNFAPRVPVIALKVMLGEMADMVTKGSRVSSEKLLSAGFTFRYPELKLALNDLLK